MYLYTFNAQHFPLVPVPFLCASKHFHKSLDGYGVQERIGDEGSRPDNVEIERFLEVPCMIEIERCNLLNQSDRI